MSRLTNEDLAIKLAEISTKIDNIKEDLTQIKPLEERIESIENFRSNIKGAGVVISAVLTFVVGIIMLFLENIIGK